MPFLPSDLQALLAPWRQKAACRDTETDTFFQADQGLAAKKVCRACPVVLECLQVSIENHEEHGIWGGAGDAARRALRRSWEKRPHDEAGPVVGCRCQFCRDVRSHLARLKADQHAGPNSNTRVRVLQANGPGATHGLRSTYARGCRCTDKGCVWSASAYGKAVTRLGLRTDAFWSEWAIGDDDDERRAAVDQAAQLHIVDAMAGLFAAVGRPGVRSALEDAIAGTVKRRRPRPLAA